MGSLCLGLLVLSLSFLGFGAYARDAGFPLWQVVYMSAVVWALPSALIFVAVIGAGSGVLAAGIAVALSAVRLLPMTIALLPLLKAERARKAWLFIAVHYVAVTAYVEGFLQLPKVPEAHRLAYFVGMGTGLMIVATSCGVIGYEIAASLPSTLSFGLILLSPLYFLLSMLKAATTLAEKVALAGGLVFGPLAHSLNAEFDLLLGGVLGGVLGYLAQQWKKGRFR